MKSPGLIQLGSQSGAISGENSGEEAVGGLVRGPEQRRQEDAADEQVDRADREQRALDEWGSPPPIAPTRGAKSVPGGPGRLEQGAEAGWQPGHRATPAGQSLDDGVGEGSRSGGPTQVIRGRRPRRDDVADGRLEAIGLSG